jgi:hypothetical protein
MHKPPLLALILSLAALTATAAEPAGSPLSDEELAGHRAGFFVLDGQQLNFSASVNSYLDGDLVLQSQLTWTDGGPVVEHAQAASAALPPDVLASLSAGGLDIKALTADAGVFVSSDGQTAFVHRAEDGQLAGVLLNTGDDRVLRQDINVNLGLPGFEATQAGMREVLTARALADDIRLGLGAIN